MTKKFKAIAKTRSIVLNKEDELFTQIDIIMYELKELGWDVDLTISRSNRDDK